MERLTTEQLASLEIEASSSSGDFGYAPGILALIAEVREHRARIAAHAAAHPERLSEADIEWTAGSSPYKASNRDEERAMAIEIQQRRAADLTPDEIAAVRDLLQYATPYFSRRSAATRSALDKILNAQGVQ